MQLLRIENDDDQWKLAEITREQGLTATKLEELIDKHLGVKKGAKKVGRPKGDKTVGAGGFAFSQKGTRLRIKADCELTGDLDVFLANLKGAIITWQHAHPIRVRDQDKPLPIPDQRPTVVLAPEQVPANLFPSREAAMKQMMEDQKHIRRPKTPEDWAEFERLAAQGPEALYAGIYGRDSFFAQTMRGKSWADLHVTDPIQACRDLVKSLQQANHAS